jgi:hypothetical protein
MTFRNRMKTCETENPYPGIKGKKNSVAWFHDRTIPTELLVGEVSANF